MNDLFSIGQDKTIFLKKLSISWTISLLFSIIKFNNNLDYSDVLCETKPPNNYCFGTNSNYWHYHIGFDDNNDLSNQKK